MNHMKIAFSIFFISFLNISLIAQDTILEKSPKQFSFEAGYRRNISSGFTNKADNGFNLAAEVAWKVSGFHKKSAVYFGVPLGYDYAMANSDIDNNTSTLFYGWIVRHEFGRDKKICDHLEMNDSLFLTNSSNVIEIYLKHKA